MSNADIPPPPDDENTSEEIPPVADWIKRKKFKTTGDFKIPSRQIDQVIGQDEAVEVVKKAAAQKRHAMLIGDPGTGKSMLARSMAELLSRDDLQDVIAIGSLFPDFHEARAATRNHGQGRMPAVVRDKNTGTLRGLNEVQALFTDIHFPIVDMDYRHHRILTQRSLRPPRLFNASIINQPQRAQKTLRTNTISPFPTS